MDDEMPLILKDKDTPGRLIHKIYMHMRKDFSTTLDNLNSTRARNGMKGKRSFKNA